MSTSTWNWCRQTSEKPAAKAMPHIDLTYTIEIIYQVRRGSKYFYSRFSQRATSLNVSCPGERITDFSVPKRLGVTPLPIALESFIIAGVLNPHIVRKAQAELDSVVGTDRLPTYEDKLWLPYIAAIMPETPSLSRHRDLERGFVLRGLFAMDSLFINIARVL